MISLFYLTGLRFELSAIEICVFVICVKASSSSKYLSRPHGQNVEQLSQGHVLIGKQKLADLKVNVTIQADFQAVGQLDLAETPTTSHEYVDSS